MQTSTAKRFQCPHCKHSYKHSVRVLPFHCRCGAVLHEITYQYGTQVVTKVSDDLPCQFRGAELREVNCGCSGKPKIYACTKHGEAYLRKLPKMTPAMVADCTMCLTCENRSRYTPGRLGVLSVVHNRVGGTETYWRTLNDMIGIVGIATPQTPKAKSMHYPVFAGNEAIEELAASVDALIVWGVVAKDELTRGPKRIAIHHGSLQSTWANSVFEEQLKWCEHAVAINEQVAEYYGVEYIPNAVDFKPVENVLRAYNDAKYVAWLHRDAPEKRPHLARRIAEALPDGWIMVASQDETRSTAKFRGIGQVDDVPYYLALANVFLSTADQEGFGLSIAEAMLAGVPVVSSPHGLGAISEIVEQVDIEDPQAWVDAILRAGPKVDAARRHIQANYAPHVVAEKWRSFLDRICPAM